jgi:hypothetical protein
LFRRSGQPCNLPYHVYDSCCSVTATPGITKFTLNNHLTTTLHKHVCEARKHLEVLRNYRNGSFAHLKKGSLSDHEYQSAASDIKKAILHIAKVCNKGKEANDALDDLERRPLDHYSFLEHRSCLWIFRKSSNVTDGWFTSKQQYQNTSEQKLINRQYANVMSRTSVLILGFAVQQQNSRLPLWPGKVEPFLSNNNSNWGTCNIRFPELVHDRLQQGLL